MLMCLGHGAEIGATFSCRFRSSVECLGGGSCGDIPLGHTAGWLICGAKGSELQAAARGARHGLRLEKYEWDLHLHE